MNKIFEKIKKHSPKMYRRMFVLATVLVTVMSYVELFTSSFKNTNELFVILITTHVLLLILSISFLVQRVKLKDLKSLINDYKIKYNELKAISASWEEKYDSRLRRKEREFAETKSKLISKINIKEQTINKILLEEKEFAKKESELVSEINAKQQTIEILLEENARLRVTEKQIDKQWSLWKEITDIFNKKSPRSKSLNISETKKVREIMHRALSDLQSEVIKPKVK